MPYITLPGSTPHLGVITPTSKSNVSLLDALKFPNMGLGVSPNAPRCHAYAYLIQRFLGMPIIIFSSPHYKIQWLDMQHHIIGD